MSTAPISGFWGRLKALVPVTKGQPSFMRKVESADSKAGETGYFDP